MYRLVRFGTLDLQYYNQVDTIGSGVTPTAYQSLRDGGALDLYGSQQQHPATVDRSKSMRLTAATEAELESLFLSLLAQRGRRDRLYREMKSGDIHWQYARLVEVTAERSYEIAKYKRIQDVTLRFVTQDACWRGALGGTWHFDAGYYFDTGLMFDNDRSYSLTASPTLITVSIGTDAGRAPTRAVRMEIDAGALSITTITLARAGGESITFSGTIAANTTLEIDTGTMQVVNDGVDAYDSLTLSPTADLAAWFSLEAGDNPITVTYTGGGTGAQVRLYYYEVWY